MLIRAARQRMRLKPESQPIGILDDSFSLEPMLVNALIRLLGFEIAHDSVKCG
jgi:hypothetical protein